MILNRWLTPFTIAPLTAGSWQESGPTHTGGVSNQILFLYIPKLLYLKVHIMNWVLFIQHIKQNKMLYTA